MGMFDYVKNVPDVRCGYCSCSLDGWQTKDCERFLDTVDFGSEKVKSTHTICDSCGAFIKVIKLNQSNSESDLEWKLSIETSKDKVERFDK